MNWCRVHKSGPPNDGSRAGSPTWKELLAREAHYSCVYCAAHERHLGGSRSFHVDHYRPRKRFPDLVNDYTNLFYCCAICNSYKGSDWPRDPSDDHSAPTYPNPCRVDLSEIIDVDPDTAMLSGSAAASRYLIERLHLNRGQLRFLRRRAQLLESRRYLATRGADLVTKLVERGLGDDAEELDLLLGFVREPLVLENARPYRPGDLR